MELDLDVYDLPGGGIGETWRETCARGHPTTRCGTAPCPRCGQYARLYYCDIKRCDGEVTPLAHEAKCPPAAGQVQA